MSAPVEQTRSSGEADETEPPRRSQMLGGMQHMWPVAAVIAAIVLSIPAARFVGLGSGSVLFIGVVALAVGLCGLSSPVLASTILLLMMYLRTPLQPVVDSGPLLIPLVGMVVLATALWMDRTPTRLRGIGAVEWAMALYVLWNVYSAVTPHHYPAGDPLGVESGVLGAVSSLSVIVHYVWIPTVVPFVLFVVGRYTFDRAAAVRAVMWAILAFTAYSAAVSILQFTGPTEIIWPRYIVDSPAWQGRAVGVANQPVVNGMVLALGIGVAMMLMSLRSEPRWRKVIAFVITLASSYALYLTHTRAAWLCGVLVLVIGAVLAKGYRRGFLTAIGITAAVVAANWSVFTSSDRKAGGIGSPGEINDRLNANQTALWAFTQKPLTGWGLDRFRSVNTYHHQQWAADIPWFHGYGAASHENELGILAELGLIGLAIWIAVLALVAYRVWKAYRTLPDDDLCGKRLAVTAIMAMAILLCTGVTVDLRFIDFPIAAVFLICGIAIGWSDRHERAQITSSGNVAGRVMMQRV